MDLPSETEWVEFEAAQSISPLQLHKEKNNEE